MSSIESRLAAARRIKDPAARAERLHELMGEAERLRRTVVSERNEATLEANETGAWAFQSLADKLGLTKAAIQKIVNEAREARG